jgi:hypothetical protein
MPDIFPARRPARHLPHHSAHHSARHLVRHLRCPTGVITKRDAQTTLRAAFNQMQIYCHPKK